jgi:leucyl-tRNA synthetase
MVYRWQPFLIDLSGTEPELETFSVGARALRRKTHQTIARITADFEVLHFNTSVAALMELSNALGDFNVEPSTASISDAYAVREALESLILMLAPYTPHFAEEVWEALGHTGGLLGGGARWPILIDELARKDEIEIPVQVNGKLRGRVIASPEASQEVLQEMALADPRVQSFTDGHQIVKVIVVPKRLVNIVVR